MNLDAFVSAAGWWSYLLLFAVTAGETAVFLGLVLPGETAILLAAALAGRGDLDPVFVAVSVVIGGVTGDSLGFALGRWYERRSFARRLRTRIRPGSRTRRARDALVRHGGPAVIGGRFIGVVRTFLPFAAGAAGMRYRRFVLYSALASLVWGAGNVLLGYFAGAEAVAAVRSAGWVGAVALSAAGAVFLVVLAVRRLRHRRTRPPQPVA